MVNICRSALLAAEDAYLVGILGECLISHVFRKRFLGRWPATRSCFNRRLLVVLLVAVSGVVNEYTARAHMVHMFRLHLKVADRFGTGAGDGINEAGGAVEDAKALAGLEFVSAENLLPVLAPEGVVGRSADRFINAVDVEIENLGRGVAERADDHAAEAGHPGVGGSGSGSL